MKPKHPDILPDHMVRKITDAAAEHGYGVARLTLQWQTEDLGGPPVARVEYDAHGPVETERDPARLAQTRQQST